MNEFSIDFQLLADFFLLVVAGCFVLIPVIAIIILCRHIYKTRKKN